MIEQNIVVYYVTAVWKFLVTQKKKKAKKKPKQKKWQTYNI